MVKEQIHHTSLEHPEENSIQVQNAETSISRVASKSDSQSEGKKKNPKIKIGLGNKLSTCRFLAREQQEHNCILSRVAAAQTAQPSYFCNSYYDIGCDLTKTNYKISISIGEMLPAFMRNKRLPIAKIILTPSTLHFYGTSFHIRYNLTKLAVSMWDVPSAPVINCGIKTLYSSYFLQQFCSPANQPSPLPDTNSAYPELHKTLQKTPQVPVKSWCHAKRLWGL